VKERPVPAPIVLGLLAAIGLAACVVLPVPQRVVHYPTLVGRLVHAESGAPAAGVLVSIGAPDACPCAHSNESGEFELVATGSRFPYTSAFSFGDPVAKTVTIWATLGHGREAKSRPIARILFYPPSFADPGERNAVPAELGVIRF
jgi:hypothetical protein